MIASMTQSHSATRPRSSSILPTSISFAAPLDMNGAGEVFSIFSIAPVSALWSAALRYDSQRTFTPALAKCAATTPPMAPPPMRATLLIAFMVTPAPAPWRCPGRRILAPLALQHRGGLAGDAGARGAQRMADRNRSAVQVHLLLRKAEIAQNGDRLAGEGLVDLEDVDVLHVQLCPLE